MKINLAIEEAKINERDEILDHLKMVTLLVSKGDFLATQKREFARRNVSLDEILDLISILHKKEMKKKKTEFYYPQTDLVVKGDAAVIREGLENIFLKIMEMAKIIQVEVDQKALKLSFKYNSEKKLNIDNKPPIRYLEEGHSYSEIFFHTATSLMRASGIKITPKKGAVDLVFPG